MKKGLLLLVILVLIIAAAITVWAMRGPKTTNTAKTNTNTLSSANRTEQLNTNETPMNENSNTTTAQKAKLAEKPIMTMETSLGTITIQLYTDDAPELTKNFIELAKAKYYDGLTFHRIVPGFVIQGGDPSGDGTGGHSYKGEGKGLADEAGALALKHEKGTVAWAKSSLPNSIGSQFYIALEPLAQLDGSYSVFGQVVNGMDVVEKIGAVQTDTRSTPTTPVTITSLTVQE